MDRLMPKLNIYDQLAYLLVGGTAISVFELLIFSLTGEFVGGQLSQWLWVGISYFVGHIIQSLANLLISENKENFTESEKEILSLARKNLKLNKLNDREIYQICYMLSLAKDIAGQVSLFNAYYSLYRGWLVISFLTAVSAIMLLVISYTNHWFWLAAVTGSILTAIFFQRKNRFFQYSRSKTLHTFLIITKKLNEN